MLCCRHLGEGDDEGKRVDSNPVIDGLSLGRGSTGSVSSDRPEIWDNVSVDAGWRETHAQVCGCCAGEMKQSEQKLGGY